MRMIPLSDRSIEEFDWQIMRKPEVSAAAPGPMLRGSDWARQQHGTLSVGGRATAAPWFIQCEVYGAQALKASVEVDAKRRGGIPVLRGTTFPVAQLLAELAESCGVGEVADNFDLDPETVKNFLNGLSALLQRPQHR